MSQGWFLHLGHGVGSWVLVQVTGGGELGGASFLSLVGAKARKTRQAGLGTVQVVQAPHLGPPHCVTLDDVLSPF